MQTENESRCNKQYGCTVLDASMKTNLKCKLFVIVYFVFHFLCVTFSIIFYLCYFYSYDQNQKMSSATMAGSIKNVRFLIKPFEFQKLVYLSLNNSLLDPFQRGNIGQPNNAGFGTIRLRFLWPTAKAVGCFLFGYLK